MPSYAHFEIDIISALSSQLVDAFSKLDTGSLADDQTNLLPKGQGVYKLYHHGSLVYVGKAEHLKKRLKEHRIKISGRCNIQVSEMSFKCLFIHPNWTTLSPENSLIQYYRKAGEGECAWNGNGFGPHDPGRNREATNKHPQGFDSQYPIRKDWVCDSIEAGGHNALTLLKLIKSDLPYLLRFEKAKKKQNELQDTTILVPHDHMTAEQLLQTIAKALPGWASDSLPESPHSI